MFRMCNLIFQVFPVILLLISLSLPVHCQPKMNIVYPKEGDIIMASDSTFIYGNFSPPSAEVRINHQQANVFPNGTFMAIVPVKTGQFSFIGEVSTNDDTARAHRNVFIPNYLKTSPTDTLMIDTSYVFPRADWVLQPGDVFKVAVKGSPGKKASFAIEGLISDLPMVELAAQKSHYWGEAIFQQGTNSQMAEVRGIYTGSYLLKSSDWADGRKIIFTLTDSLGNSKTVTAPGKLSIDFAALPKIGQLSNNIKQVPRSSRFGSLLYFPFGTRVKITAHRGDFVRVRYSAFDDIWIKSENIELLPSGTILPEKTVSGIRTASLANWTDVELTVNQKLPYLIEQALVPPRLEITFWGINSTVDTSNIVINDPLLRSVRWEETMPKTFRLTVELNQQQLWGHKTVFEIGKFHLLIKKQPPIAPSSESPLKNRIICLDPGHGSDLGAVGASGIPEKDLNFEYCLAMKIELEKTGAIVALTRTQEGGPSLADREKFAEMINADVLLSVHFNGLPDGVDALKFRGISTYYHQKHSYQLAHLLHQHLLNETHQPNFGFFHSNLTICRAPHTISVLIELGFLTHPLDEMLITSAAYKRQVVTAIVKALEEFFEKGRQS